MSALGRVSHWVEQADVTVLNEPFIARGNLATAGGCLASQYLGS
ncbi:hypothetical protein GPA27_12235 [Aromatoleum toluolicum]|nr:hypothetical protein [Aromatoleum toluolicum]MCQ6963993.1 hypothetical protein [Aromatoleum toluolicum]